MAGRPITEEDKKRAQRLKALYQTKKKEIGLTQVQCAEKLKISQSAISQFLNAIVPLNTDAILAFAELLETKPSEIDPKLSEDRFKTKEMFQPVPIIGTLSNRQPSDYYRKLWLKKPDYHAVGFEVDLENPDYEKDSILILLLNKKPIKNSKVLLRLRKRNRFQFGKFLGDETFNLSGVIQTVETNEISYLAKISEVVRP